MNRKRVDWSGDWCFCQLADTQLGMMNNDRDWEDEIGTAKRAVSAINALKPTPRFVVVCGDLVNAYPNGPKANIKAHEAQKKDFREIMRGLKKEIELVCVCGNHDVGDRISKATARRWHRSFGPDYKAFSVDETRCIVINSSLYAAKNERLWTKGFLAADEVSFDEDAVATQKSEALALAKRQDTWLDVELNALRIDSPRHIIVFCHIPPFIYRPDEPKGYFNLAPTIRRDLLTTLKRAGVRKIFCGHFHRNAGGQDEDIEVIVTRAIGCVLPYTREAVGKTRRAEQVALEIEGLDYSKRKCDEMFSGLRVVSVSRDTIAHRFFTLHELQMRLRENASVSALVGKGEHASDWTRPREQNDVTME